MSLEELIAQIRPRPGIYIGVLSLTRLQMYLYGWQHALTDRNVATDEDRSASEKLYGFHAYTARKYGMSAVQGWSGILLCQVAEDECAALDLFFRDWDEYLATPESDDEESEINIHAEPIEIEITPDE